MGRLVDRFVVMAYDEHWSGGQPGPVASIDWGRRVVAFAQSTVDPAKLVIGIPFYGRAWAEKALSRAYKAGAVARILSLQKPESLHRTDGVPDFEYEETVRVRVFFDDKESHRIRISQYSALGVANLAFWRLGQETPDFWPLVRLVSSPSVSGQPSGRTLLPRWPYPFY